MRLEQKHYDAIKMYMVGHKATDIAKKCGVNRSTFYNWLNDKDFSKEMDRIRTEVQTSTKNYVESNIKLYIDEIERLALDEDTSTKVRADLLKYLVNRVWGNTTVKTEVSVNSSEEESEFNINEFMKNIQKDNIDSRK